MVADGPFSPFVAELKRAFGNYRGSSPTNQFDRAQWFDAAMQREQAKPRKPMTQTQAQAFLMARNAWRWRRLKADITYFNKQLARAGVYTDVRDLL